MIKQRLHLICPLALCEALEGDTDRALAPLWLRLTRGSYEGLAVASLQATDSEAAMLTTIVLLLPGVVLTRGPDDDGPRPLDKTVDVGDTLPLIVEQARYTWPRVVADRGLTRSSSQIAVFRPDGVDSR